MCTKHAINISNLEVSLGANSELYLHLLWLLNTCDFIYYWAHKQIPSCHECRWAAVPVYWFVCTLIEALITLIITLISDIQLLGIVKCSRTVFFLKELTRDNIMGYLPDNKTDLDKTTKKTMKTVRCGWKIQKN